jgi:hypothetical protein
MEKIELTDKETKLELQSILESIEIKYSKLDTKEKLLERIREYNTLDEIKSQSLIRDKIEKEAESIDITGNQYCNIRGYHKRVKYFIEKKYKRELFSIATWDLIFKKEGLV